MATFQVVEGAPGQGKSLHTAREAKRLFERNLSWYKKGNPIRYILSNIKFSEEFEKFCTVDNICFIKYWSNIEDLTTSNDVDIIWDEIATELDARNWTNLTAEVKRFLSQYRKRGIDIYANTQDFSMVDQRARLMISGVLSLKKIIGSRDLSTTKPKPKRIWGVIIIRRVVNFRETAPDKKKFELIPTFMFIKKELVEIYNTRQDIPLGKASPLKHEIRYCEHHLESGGEGNCNFCKISHT